MAWLYVSSVYSSIFTVASRSWTRINVSLSLHKAETGELELGNVSNQISFRPLLDTGRWLGVALAFECKQTSNEGAIFRITVTVLSMIVRV